MKCKRCKRKFNGCDSIGSDLDLCQDCWELECDEEWWAMVTCLNREINAGELN